MFLNLKNGEVTVNSYRLPEAMSTTQEDFLSSIDKDQCLTAAIDNVDELPDSLRELCE